MNDFDFVVVDGKWDKAQTLKTVRPYRQIVGAKKLINAIERLASDQAPIADVLVQAIRLRSSHVWLAQQLC